VKDIKNRKKRRIATERKKAAIQAALSAVYGEN